MIVMYGGYFIEEAPVKELYGQPQHPYTLGLLGSLPRLDADRAQRLVSIEGMPPVLREMPAYCPFAPRCHYRHGALPASKIHCWQRSCRGTVWHAGWIPPRERCANDA